MDRFMMSKVGSNGYKLMDEEKNRYQDNYKILNIDNFERIRDLALVDYNTSGRSKEFIFMEIVDGAEYYYNMFPKDFYSLVLDNTINNGKISINSKVVKRGRRCGLKQVK